MASPLHPTNQDDAAFAAAAPPTDAVTLSPRFLDRLRSGEREAFLGFFEAYRLPVFNFVRRFTQTDAEAAGVTREAFVATYRRILLREGALEPRPWLYQAALALCRERGEASVDDGRLLRRASPQSDAARETGRGELRRRFEQALQTLGDRHYTILLLHDLHGLRPEEIATVLDAAVGAGPTLLFQAREAFLRSFNESAADSGKASCRLAEQVAAGAVGRTLATDELRRLRDHAGYCRPCRKTMRSWGSGPIGLALFLTDAPLPPMLDEAPVFAAAGGQVPTAGAAAAGGAALAEVGAVAAMAAQLRRAVRSRAAAYMVAAACLTAVAVMAVYVSQHAIRLVPEPVSAPISLLLPPQHQPQHPATVRAARSGAAKSGATATVRKALQTSGAGERQTAVAETASVVVARPTASGSGTTVSGNGPASGNATTSGSGRSASGGGTQSGGQPTVGSGSPSSGQPTVGSGTRPSGGQSTVGSASRQGSVGRAAGNHAGRTKQRRSVQHARSRAVPGSHRAAHTRSRLHGRHGAARTRSRRHGRHGATRTTTQGRGRHGTGRGAWRAGHRAAYKTTRHGGRSGGRSRGRGRRHHGR